MAGIAGSVTGINSQLDTTAIIDAMLTYDKQNITLLQYDQTLKTNQIATFQAINTRLLAFQTQAGLLAKADSYTAAKLSVSDEDYLTATAGDNVGLGTYSLNITALAQNHQVASQGFSQQEIANLGTGTITIAVGDASPKTITIDSSSSSLEGIKNAINNANAGVKASVVNDGSSSNAYRLLITADKTGAKNQIEFTSNLSGSKTLDFSGSSFDQVEKLSFDGAATSTPRLGTTASYTGTQNKTYSFTVKGIGTQTIGSGDITIDWTDGTNSGSVVVSSADTEVELSGAGSDGLKLAFSAGTLVAGDTFQVQSFAPLLQRAQDARISMGSTNGGGSPITVTSENNFVKNLIPGVTLNLKKVTTTDPIIISADRDVAKVEQQVDDFIQKFNDVLGALDDQFKFDPNAKENTGVLFGDRTLMMVQDSLRGSVTSKVSGLTSKYKMLADIGIRIGSTGKLAVVDRSKLEGAIKDYPDEVRKLLAPSGESSNSKVSFVALSESTKISTEGYDVEITQAARQGYLQGGVIADPSVTPLTIDATNKNLSLKIDGMISETITLTEKSYSSWQSLVDELQQKINADSKVGAKGVKVTYFDNGATGYLILTSGTYGKSSKVELQSGTSTSAYATLGLATAQVFGGQDVAGTINGEKTTGVGQFLSGNSGNANTEGLKLLVELTDADLRTGNEASVKVLRGIASKLQDLSNSLTKNVNGTFSSRTSALQKQIDDIKTQVENKNQMMELKRQRLIQQFQEMEDVLGKLNNQSAYLSGQLANLSSLFSSSKNGSNNSGS